MEIRDDNAITDKMYPYLSYASIHAKYLAFSLILITISVFGDQLLLIKRSVFNHYLIALSDNTIHALIANISWLLIYVSRGAPIGEYIVLTESIICAITASLIDLDHIIVAQSFDLKLVSELKSRPFLHNSSLALFICLTVIIMGLLSNNWMFHTFGWILMTAFFTHHLRDALRHGFWVYPFNTKPVPFWTYVAVLTSYPFVCSCLMQVVAQQFLIRHKTHAHIKYTNVESEEV